MAAKFLWLVFRKAAQRSLGRKLIHEEEITLKTALSTRKLKISFLYHSLLHPRGTREAILNFFSVMEKQPIQAHHLKKIKQIHHLAYFRILSGYLSSGQSLESAINKLEPALNNLASPTQSAPAEALDYPQPSHKRIKHAKKPVHKFTAKPEETLRRHARDSLEKAWQKEPDSSSSVDKKSPASFKSTSLAVANNTRERELMSSGNGKSSSHPPNLQLISVIYRYYLEDTFSAVEALDSLCERTEKITDNFAWQIFYTETKNLPENENYPLLQNTSLSPPQKVNHWGEALQSTAQFLEAWAHEEVLIHFHPGDYISLRSQTETLLEKLPLLKNTDLVVLRGNFPLDYPYHLRIPERSASFALRGSLLQSNLEFAYAQHPITLLAAAWSQTYPSQRCSIVDYSLPPVHQETTTCSIPAEIHVSDRLALRVFSEALLRQAPLTFSGLYQDLPFFKKSLPLSIETEPTEDKFSIQPLLPKANTLDVIFITDFRIRGGGVKSVLEEARIVKELGYRVGAMHLDAITFVTLQASFAQHTFDELAQLEVPLLNGLPNIQAKLAILRYPPILASLPHYISTISIEKAVIVVNQPPRRLASEPEFYQPAECRENAKILFSKLYPREAEWWPNGPDARQAMLEYEKDIPLAKSDWLNVIRSFADDRLLEERTGRIKNPNRPITLGRHTRDVINKWPSNPQEILSCYPEDPGFEVLILGGARVARKVLKYYPANWRVWEYGEKDVTEYLRELDFFVFFPHEERIEPMARCVIEAMASGLPVILPEKFKGYYGKSPLYCKPNQVIPHLEKFRGNPLLYWEKCWETRQEARELFGPKSMAARLTRLGLPSTEQQDLEGYCHG